MAEELLGDAVEPERRGHARIVELLEQPGAATADAAVVLQVNHEVVVTRQVHQSGGDRDDPAGVDDGHADTLGHQPLAHLERRGRHRADAHDEHVAGAVAEQHVDVADPVDGPDVVGRRALREAHHGRGVVDLDGLAEQLTQPGGVPRGGQP